MLGFVNVHKPIGLTSTQVTSQVRRIFSAWSGAKLAAGHLGTLDPGASGVLPIALGKATRLLPLIEDRRKTYLCTLVLGRTTTTADASGDVVRETPVPSNAFELIERVLPRFIGPIEQIPPMYSAVHHQGKRLYDLARAGAIVERSPRTIVIHDAHLLPPVAEGLCLRVMCGEGTYIRTLCEDIGAAIGVAAHMGSLLREAAGPFAGDRSRTLDDIARAPAETLLAPEEVIPLPAVLLDHGSLADFRMGRSVTLKGDAPACAHVFVYSTGDCARELVGVGARSGGRLAPRKVFI